MGLFDELKKLTHTYEDEDDDYEEDFPDVKRPDNTAALFDERRAVRSEERRNKVVNIHATTQLKVVLVSPQHFEDAIAAGSTMIRVGTAIFGARSYPAT